MWIYQSVSIDCQYYLSVFQSSCLSIFLSINFSIKLLLSIKLFLSHTSVYLSFFNLDNDENALPPPPPPNQVNIPSEYASVVQNGLSERSAMIEGTEESLDAFTTIICEVPLNNMFGYMTELRTLTQGKGDFSMEYSRYCPASTKTQQEVIQEYQENLEEAQSGQGAGKKKKKKN